jgi:uroporphyrinogen-III synthase
MSARRNASAKGRLDGVRVLVGRARHQASALSASLRKLGAEVIEIPFIEIRKPRSFRPLDSALKNLHTYDWLILTSVNGVEAMWDRMSTPASKRVWAGRGFNRAAKPARKPASAAGVGWPQIAAIGPATKKAIEQHGAFVDVVPKEYVAESVVRSLRRRVKGKRVLLVRAKVARDVIPRQLRKAGAHVDVVEAYETVIPKASRSRLRNALDNSKTRPHVIAFTSSSTVRNFVNLLEPRWRRMMRSTQLSTAALHKCPRADFSTIATASIGPVTSSTLRECGLAVDIQAKTFTIPALVDAISQAFAR